MQEIIEKILAGEITRDNDESYAGGLWDYAGEIVYDSNNPTDESLQAEIYYALWEVVDIFNEKRSK